MIRSNFLSREDRRELLSCVKRQREDHGVARRANALLLLDDGKSCVEIAQVLYLDDDTVCQRQSKSEPKGSAKLASIDRIPEARTVISAAERVKSCA